MFVPFDKFIFRTSLLPAESHDYSHELIKLLESGFYKDVIYLSSSDLFAAIKEGKDNKKESKINSSLLKYYLRSKYRCTPFGLLASIGIGSINDQMSSVILEHFSRFRRNTRLDMNCLCSLLQELAKKDTIKKYLRYFPNSSLYPSGEKLRYVEYHYFNNERRHILTGVDNNQYVENILYAAKEGATIRQLADAIVDEEIEEEEKLLFVEELINAQLLVSELEPSVTGAEMELQVAGLLDNLARGCDIPEDKHFMETTLEKINDIRSTLKSIDEAGIADGNIKKYELIEELMRELDIPYQKKYLFQSNLVAKTVRASLNRSLADKALLGADIMSRFSKVILKTNINVFKEAFYERWEEEEVPLVLALDNEQGIGYLQNLNERNDIAPLIDDLALPYRFPDEQKVEFSGKLFQFWHTKYTESVKSDAFEIVLDDKDLEHFPSKVNELADTFSIMLSVVNDGSEEEENYLYLKAVGGSCSSYLLGRFCHDDASIHDFTEEMIAREETLYKDKILAEIIHLPESRTGNVIFRPVMRNYEIPYLAKSGVDKEYQVAITDLMICIRNNRIVLRSKRLDKEIIPRLTTAHNFSNNSLPLYQFLGDLQNQDCLWGVQLDLGVVISNASFIPRVSFKKSLILQPAKWQLRKPEFRDLVECEASNLMHTFEAFRIRWKLPAFIAITEGDNELVINTNNEDSIRLFVNEIRSKQFITLLEAYVDKTDGLIKSEAGGHTNELILSYYRENARTQEVLPVMIKEESQKRKNLPGDEWLYFKIYTGYKTADEILTQVIRSLSEQLLQEKKILKWFFIRYTDPKFHIRLRFLLKDKNDCGSVIVLLNERLRSYTASGAIWNIQLDSYKRELERYGNRHIEQAENLFFRDSETVVTILNLIEGAEGETVKWLTALRSVEEYLDAFGFKLEEKHKYIDELRGYFATEFAADKDLNSQLDKKFRKNKSVIEYWLSHETDTIKNKLEDYLPVLEALSSRTENLLPDIKLLCCVADKKLVKIWVASFLHMNINRIFRSRNRLHEYVVYDLLERYYRYQAGRKKALAKADSSLSFENNEKISHI